MPRVFLIDNDDSFTYNLVQGFEALGASVRVRIHDRVRDEDWLEDGWATHLVVSPGPGRPRDVPRTVRAIRSATGRLPVLGVCLGLQAMAERFGAATVRSAHPTHGKSTPVRHDGAAIFRGLPDPFEAGRYHSLAVDPESVPPDLLVSAWTGDGEIMGLRHRELPMEGVQFHPESVLTPDGPTLLRNFLRLSA